MNDQQLAAERAAFEKWCLTMCGHVLESYWQVWQAALAQREPVADGEVAFAVKELREYADVKEDGAFNTFADLLERTEAARLTAENRPCCPYGEAIEATPEKQRETMLHDTLTERDDLRYQLSTERARSEKLVEALRKYEQD